MKKHNRIKGIQKQLTPLQIVLLDIQEARRHGSAAAFARALVSGTTKSTRVDDIEAMVRERCRGEDDGHVREELRLAQKEAMFLNRLVVETWTSFATNVRAWNLTAAAIGLLHALVIEMAHSEREPVEALAKTMGSWDEFARTHLDELRVELEAARMIEREYFDGAPIMFEEDERMLAAMIAAAEHEAQLAAGANAKFLEALNGKTPRPTANKRREGNDIQQRAAQLANERADFARVRVLDWFSEGKKAERILEGYVKDPRVASVHQGS